MKKLLPIAGIVLSASLSVQAQSTIADWTFESFTASTGQTAGPYSPEAGAGSATGYHSGTGGTTTYSSPAGNGSAHSYSANGWAVGDYYQFQVSTIGATGNIYLSFDQTSSTTGPSSFQLEYSLNGTTFINIGSAYTIQVNGTPNTAWNATTYNPVYNFSPDLSSISSTIDNQSTVYFRMADASTTSENGGTVASTGTDRIDNVYVGLVPVPEPSTYALIASGAAGLFFIRRRK